MANFVFYPTENMATSRCVKYLSDDSTDLQVIQSAGEGIRILEKGNPDLFIISAKLSWSDVSQLLQLLQQKSFPVLFIDCKQANMKHLKIMYHGPCQVLPESFSAAKIRKSVATLLEKDEHILKHGSLVMNTENKQVTMNGGELTLTSQEFSLLQALMESPNEPVSREDLLRSAWGYKGIGITRTVDVHVQRLRRKLGNSYIETVYRTGYKLCPA